MKPNSPVTPSASGIRLTTSVMSMISAARPQNGDGRCAGSHIPAPVRMAAAATRIDTISIAPRGWLSPALNENWATPDLLKEEGYEYTCDWVHDDQPTWLSTRAGPLMTLPYSLEVNDLPAFLARHASPEDFCRTICAQFDQLYEEGESQARVMAIALHPFVIGTPYRIRALADALRHIQNHSRVWFARGGEIADDFIKQCTA